MNVTTSMQGLFNTLISKSHVASLLGDKKTIVTFNIHYVAVKYDYLQMLITRKYNFNIKKIHVELLLSEESVLLVAVTSLPGATE